MYSARFLRACLGAAAAASAASARGASCPARCGPRPLRPPCLRVRGDAAAGRGGGVRRPPPPPPSGGLARLRHSLA